MTHPPAGPSTPTPPPGPSRAEALLPVAEVARLWRCSRDHVYDLISAGELRTVNLGTGRAKTRVPESSLAQYIARHGSHRPLRGRVA